MATTQVFKRGREHKAIRSFSCVCMYVCVCVCVCVIAFLHPLPPLSLLFFNPTFSPLSFIPSAIGVNPGLGDGLCIVGALLYASSNVAQEMTVRGQGPFEFLGLVGLWGSIIAGVQLAILERKEIAGLGNSAGEIGLLVAFAACLFMLYSLVPFLLRLSSATMMNLALLTSDVYSLLFGLFLFHYSFSVLYFAAFVTIIVGLVIYHLSGQEVHHKEEGNTRRRSLEPLHPDDEECGESRGENV